MNDSERADKRCAEIQQENARFFNRSASFSTCEDSQKTFTFLTPEEIKRQSDANQKAYEKDTTPRGYYDRDPDGCQYL